MPNVTYHPDLKNQLTPIEQRAFDKAIDALKEARHSHGLNLESLSSGIFSIRATLRHRLLARPAIVNTEMTWVVFAVVLYHAYDKAPILREEDIDSYLHSYTDSTENPVQESVIPHTQLSVYKNQVIRWSQAQLDALSAPLPLALYGTSGSGKTCVLTSLVEKFSDKDEARILFTTQSQQLLKEMEKNYVSSPLSEKRAVEFKSYEDLLIEHTGATAGQFVDEASFMRWFPEHCKRQQTIAKAKALPPNVLSALTTHPKKIYQELRNISGYPSLEAYSAIGKKNTLFSDPSLKEGLWEIYNNYIGYLAHQKLIDPAFSSLNVSARYDLIVVDESPDYSRCQLGVLYQLAINQAICFAADANQSLFDAISITPFLNQFPNMNIVQLPHAYRNPPAIIDLANIILEMKRRITGGVADKFTAPTIEKAPCEHLTPGDIYWLTKTTDDHAPALLAQACMADFAVVTLPEYVEEAIALFGTVLVMTPEQIKGLEYRVVVAYRLLDREAFKDMNSRLANVGDKPSPTGRRVQSDEYDDAEALTILFNELFTVITRTTQTFVFYQSLSHGLRHVVSPIHTFIHSQRKPSIVFERPSEQQVAHDWEKERRAQEEAGNTEIANRISRNRSKMLSTTTASAAAVSTPTSDIQLTPAVPLDPEQLKKYLLFIASFNETKKNKTAFPINLQRILESKSLSKWLFGRPYVYHGHPCVFDIILDNTELFRIFIDVFCTNISGHIDLLKKNKPEFNYYKKFAQDWLPQNPSFIDKGQFNTQVQKWCQLKLLTGENANTIANHLLLVLMYILEEEPSLAALIETNTFYSSANINRTIMPWVFDGVIGGDRLLKLLCEHNVKFSDDVTASFLCRIKAIKTAVLLPNAPLLYALCRYNPEFLLSMLLKKETLLGEIVEELKQQQNGIKAFIDVCVPHLIFTEEQLKMLAKLVQSPDIASAIDRQLLFSTTRDKPTNIFQILILSEKGLSTLNILFKTNPTLAQSITLADLSLTQPGDSDPNNRLGFFVVLSQSKQGTDFLIHLLRSNPSIVNTIENTDLFTAQPAQPKFNSFDYLAGTINGQHILMTLFNIKPSLVNGKFFESSAHQFMFNKNAASIERCIKTLIYPTDLGSIENQQRYIGDQLFKLILEKNEFIQKEILNDGFVKQFLYAHSSNAMSLFGRLLFSPRAHPILISILNHNPNIGRQVTKEILCQSITNGAPRQFIAECLIEETATPILEILFRQNRELFHIMKVELMRSLLLETDHMASILKAALTHQNGRKMLQQLGIQFSEVPAYPSDVAAVNGGARRILTFFQPEGDSLQGAAGAAALATLEQ